MCSPTSKKLCHDNECQTCFNRSFASHPKAVYWSINNNATPRQTFKSSNFKYKFNCDVCNHEFEMILYCVSGMDNWCQYCAGRKLCNDYENCMDCFNKSFAAHDRSQYWSPKNNKNPRDVFISESTEYLFICEICSHEFKKRPNTINIRDSWCPYCCYSTAALCSNDCAQCFNKSFASHERSKYWSNKNNISPRLVCKTTHKKYVFKCENDHEFVTSVASITNMNSWCPKCLNKTEKKLLKFLNDNYKITYQPKFDWCRNPDTNRELPFDFLLNEYKIIIELDGGQHFKQVRNWLPPEEQQKRDLFKMNLANNYGYTIIRIFQEDVWDDNEWVEKLTNKIKPYDEPTCIFISSGDHYKNMKKEITGNNT